MVYPEPEDRAVVPAREDWIQLPYLQYRGQRDQGPDPLHGRVYRPEAGTYDRYKEGLKDLPVTMNPYDKENSEPNFWLSCCLIG